MLNWSEYENEAPPPINHRPWWLEVLIGLGCAFAIAVIVGGFAGCATKTEPTSNVCYMRILGHTEEGYTVVMQSCVTPEAFAESQK